MGLKYNEPYNSCSLRSSNPKILSFQSNGKARINGFGKVTLSGKLSVSGKPFKKTINISKGIKKITLKKNSYVYCIMANLYPSPVIRSHLPAVKDHSNGK